MQDGQLPLTRTYKLRTTHYEQIEASHFRLIASTFDRCSKSCTNTTVTTAPSTKSTSIMSDRKPTNNQLSQDLPGPTAYLTGHDQNTGKAIVHSRRPVDWQTYDSDNLAMSVAYTTSFPADLNADADVSSHEDKVKTGKLGLVSGGGTVLRYVDFAPGYTCMMHRTQSVDYGIVLEGQVESVLDSGETQVMGRGDVMVQRATMHAWRNPSEREWARMIFCLQDCRPLFIKGERFGEDLGRGTVSAVLSCWFEDQPKLSRPCANVFVSTAGGCAAQWERCLDSWYSLQPVKNPSIHLGTSYPSLTASSRDAPLAC